ncbi:Flp pilus assembly protein CpaB [Nocardioides nematodiphilus]|uniref:Flp pilus assembly protein CpaB n=1 Tax=Nocardioides nematodiphilus TaxID=2849669 RepID=UPI001CD961D7|nr:Flp pilus assembly protein CpaB [Nocardioides nematodiphilus]MCA1983949.1 Flp pilus assembly protein CpaB [Nocardioides nematodiphilus]
MTDGRKAEMDRRKLLVVAAAIVAALGVVLVLIYAKGADNRAQDKYDTVEVLTATAQINPGESIDQASTGGKLALRPVTRGELLAGYQTATTALAGQVALATIYPGEQIIAGKFGTSAVPVSALPIPDGKTAISISLSDPARVAGFVNPGSEIAVFMSGTAGGQPFTRLLLPKVTVIGVGATAETAAGGASADSAPANTEQLPATLITLAVTQQEAQKILFAQGNGQLAVSLTTGTTKVTPGPATTLANLFG